MSRLVSTKRLSAAAAVAFVGAPGGVMVADHADALLPNFSVYYAGCLSPAHDTSTWNSRKPTRISNEGVASENCADAYDPAFLRTFLTTCPQFVRSPNPSAYLASNYGKQSVHSGPEYIGKAYTVCEHVRATSGNKNKHFVSAYSRRSF
jgi:hypothetical protein